MKIAWAALFAIGGLWLAGSVQAQTAPPPNDYSDRGNWACFPGATPNACQTELDTTFISADGRTRVEAFKPDPDPKIDCFYVYPTVSTDPGLLATMKLEREERAVVAQQFARFGSVCRLYAPLYRQFTITALRAAMTGHPLEGSNPRPLTPYFDVRDAWKWYLAHENHGRGVVLIGHSQGSAILTPLIAHDIEGQPSQKLIVSAILMGTGLGVPKGADVGGDFKSLPLCHSARQLGCVIAYASFRDDSPPPANSRFGKPRNPGPGLVAACVNPANLAGRRRRAAGAISPPDATSSPTPRRLALGWRASASKPLTSARPACSPRSVSRRTASTISPST